jgi:hypothetical protein
MVNLGILPWQAVPGSYPFKRSAFCDLLRIEIEVEGAGVREGLSNGPYGSVSAI